MTEMQNQSGNTNQSWKVAAGILGLLFVGALIFGIMFFNKYQATVHKAADLGTQLDSTRTQLEGELSSLNSSYTAQIALNDTLSVDLQEKINEVEDLKVRIEKARKDLK